MPKPINALRLTTDEVEALSRAIGASLIDLETTDTQRLFLLPREYTESEPDDRCLLRLRINGEERYLTIENSLHYFADNWDVPKPRVRLTEEPPQRDWSPFEYNRRTFKFDSTIKRIEVYQESFEGEDDILAYDDTIRITLQNGQSFAIYVDGSTMCWVKFSNTDNGIRELLKDSELRLVLPQPARE